MRSDIAGVVEIVWKGRYWTRESSDVLKRIYHEPDATNYGSPSAETMAATQTVSFTGLNGLPLQDVSEFSDVLDWVLLVNYNILGCDFCSFRLSLSSCV